MQRSTFSTSLANLMAGATRLTRSGKLMQATAAIQRALGRATAHRAAGPSPTGATVLDGLVTEVNTSATRTDAPATAAGAHFTAHGFATPTGPRSYKLFTPSAAATASAPLPMLLMLHGCTQNPDDFAAGTRMNELAEREGWFVLYPAQAKRSNAAKCWNWFNPADQRHGGGEPALLSGMTHEVMARCRVDPDQVYVAGLSAGGAMAAILGHEYPDLFAAVGVHSGLAQGAASDVASAFATMKSGQPRSRGANRSRTVPTIVFHGDNDATVHPAHGQHVITDALETAGPGLTPGLSSDAGSPGRRATRSVYADSQGRVQAEHWVVHGAGHAWSGGSAGGSYTDPQGPDASAEMLRFFAEHPRGQRV